MTESVWRENWRKQSKRVTLQLQRKLRCFPSKISAGSNPRLPPTHRPDQKWPGLFCLIASLPVHRQRQAVFPNPG